MQKTIIGLLAVASLFNYNNNRLSDENQEILRHLSIEYIDDGQGGTVKTIRLTSANFQIGNGTGITGTTNGLGNLIVGYGGATPGTALYVGSHNVILGTDNSHLSYGGIIAGDRNLATSPFSSVLGGSHNEATEVRAIVIGGKSNTASDDGAIVVGGAFNTAAAWRSVVVGGGINTTSGFHAVVVGGALNEAVGQESVVSGGLQRSTTGQKDWAAASLYEND